MELVIVPLIFLCIFLVFGGTALLIIVFAPKYYLRCPQAVRGHLCAALIWTAITLFQTASLLTNSNVPNLIGIIVAMIAGWTMISSWRQFTERQQGILRAQSRRSLPQRLFVQTLWGPILVWFVAAMLPLAASKLVWRAITHRDIVGIHFLKACGFSAMDDTNHLESGLVTVVENQDTLGVLTYLEAGKNEIGNFDCMWLLAHPLEKAVVNNNTVITDLLLRYGDDSLKENNTSALMIAVHSGNLRQVRTMLHHGGIDQTEGGGWELRDAARKRHDQKMLDLLRSAAKNKKPPIAAPMRSE